MTSVEDKFIIFGAPDIGEDEIQEVVATLRSGWLGSGPRVAEFEKAFRQYRRAPAAVAVNSCTAALHLSFLAAGVGPGDEVIAPALTFCATVNAIIHAGAKPVLVDVDPTTQNMDPGLVESKITSRTKALVPVHFAGRPCDMERLGEIARRHRLTIVEDCAHAIEAEYQGRPVGTFGDFGCFSFYVTKNMTTGEGGMVLTRHADEAARVKMLALHGLSADAWKRYSDSGYKHYFVNECGFKYNMMDLQAAIGIHQLKRLEESLQRRREIWDRYDEAFQELPVVLPAPEEAGTRHARHLYSLLVRNAEEVEGLSARDAFIQGMTKRRIGVGVHYLCLAEHPYYQKSFGWQTDDYPQATRIGRQTVSLPLSGGLSDEEVSRVIDATRKLLST